VSLKKHVAYVGGSSLDPFDVFARAVLRLGFNV